MSQFKLRLKLLLADVPATVALIVSTVIVLAVILSMKSYAAERSALPVGLCLMEDSTEALELVNSIGSCEALYVYEGTTEELEDLLADGYINCIFTVPEGYGERIEAGETEELVNVMAAEDDKIAILCSDIVAGFMIDRICTVRTFNRYDRLNKSGIDTTVDDAGYRAYVEELAKDDLFAFNFDVEFIDTGSKELTSRDITNSMLYMQVIAGFIGLLIMLTAFMACEGIAREAELGLLKRMRTAPGGRLSGWLLQILAVMTYLLPLPIAVSVLFGIDNDMKCALKLLLMSLLLEAGFVICSFAVSLITKGVSAYQIAGSAIIIVFGVMGFLSIFLGLLGVDIFRISPLARYIAGFVGSLQV